MGDINEMVGTVKAYLAENGREANYDEDNNFFIVRQEIGGVNDEGLIFLQMLDDCVLFRCMTSLKVTAKVKNAVAEYLNRVNDALINGCFVLDYDDGRVVFKAYIGCYGGTVTDEQLADAFASCELAYEEFGEGLNCVVSGQIKDVKSLFVAE